MSPGASMATVVRSATGANASKPAWWTIAACRGEAAAWFAAIAPLPTLSANAIADAASARRTAWVIGATFTLRPCRALAEPIDCLMPLMQPPHPFGMS